MTLSLLSETHSAPRTPRLLLPAMLTLVGLTLVGITPPLHADSPFLRGRAGATQSAATASTAATGAATDSADPDEPAVLALGPRTVTVAPGANAILELAIDHLNRIVTPFERPSVRTVSELSTEVEGHVVYVATASEVPATLYISAGDASGTTIALTLGQGASLRARSVSRSPATRPPRPSPATTHRPPRRRSPTGPRSR